MVIRHCFAVTVLLPVSPERVWDRVTTQAGINDELRPFLAMTMPKAFRGKSIADVHSGTHIGRSMLFGMRAIPIGKDDITIDAIVPGTMFRERSRMTGMREWEHERTLARDGAGTRLTDRITFVPALPLSMIPGGGTLLERTLRALFGHRHRRLVRYFSDDRQVADGTR